MVTADGASRAAPTVLVVAGWYPSVDSRTSGRFVADQVRALAATGRVRPVVLSFDPLPVWGSRRLRERERAAVEGLLEAWSSHPSADPLHPEAGASHAPGPVARLPVPAPDAGTPARRLVEERAAALERVVRAVESRLGAIALVHAHTALPDGAAAARLAASLRVPLVLTEHSSTLPAIGADPARRVLYAEATSASAAVIAVSRALADEIERLDPGVASRLHVIPNVVHVDDFSVSDGGRTPGELLFVGNRKASKGIGVLLEAAGIAATQRPGLSLRLLGPPGAPAEEARWRAAAASMGDRLRVLFDAETGRPAVAAAMARADVFVHPSPRETFGVVAAEALASGLPVVAADSGGVTEILGPEAARYGRVVPPGDASAMAAAILDVLANRSRFSAEDARAMAVERFGPTAVTNRLLEVYADVTASAGLAPALEGRAPSGDASPPDPGGRLVVIGLDRRRAAAVLADLPAPVRADAVLVTGEDAATPLPADLAGVVEVAGAKGRHGSLRAIVSTAGRDAAARRRGLWRRPVVLARELLWRSRRREEALERRAAAALEEAIRGDADGLAPRVVALDAFDALVASPLVASGRLVALPGAGRWLADAGDVGPGPQDAGPGDAGPNQAGTRRYEAGTPSQDSGPDDAQR